MAKFYNQNPILYPIVIVCVFAVQFWWVWLIARKRQNWARWISLIVVIIGIPTEILGFTERFRFNATSTIASDLAFGISLIAVLLLFRRDARIWFADRPFTSDEGRPSPG